MELEGKSAALYGRFSTGARERLAAAIAARGGRVARDLTRSSDLLVVGAHAWPLVEAGHLTARLADARARGIIVYAERRFDDSLSGAGADAATFPLERLACGLERAQIDVIAAFDVVRLDGECCRFADAGPLKTAGELIAAGRSLAEAVRILTKARDAPKGRRKIVLDARGEAALEWESGLTTLDGQGRLPLEDGASVDDLFEAAALAEAEGALEEAARLYDLSARVDRKDPIACFNLGNIRLASDAFEEAALAFRRAVARDPELVEARYNLAQAYERLGRPGPAREELTAALAVEPDYGDARFNLAQLALKDGALAEAKGHFERYLACAPPPEWAAKARRAIQYCAAALSSAS
jgi:tetratricopeptide (TPR) repeat protein